jgi:NAD(P) transhydrogenase subunit beta
MIESVDLLLPPFAVAIAASAVWIQRGRAGALRLVAAHAGFTGAAAAAIGLVALFRAAAAAVAATGLAEMEQAAADFGVIRALLAVLGMLAGAAVLSAAPIVLARLSGLIGICRFAGQRGLHRLCWLAACVLGVMIVFQLDERLVAACLLVGLVLGVGLALPPASAELPRLTWAGSALAGFALAGEGFVMRSPWLLLAGVAVGAAGALQVRRLAAAAPHSP